MYDEDPEFSHLSEEIQALVKGGPAEYITPPNTPFTDLRKRQYLRILQRFGTAKIAAQLCGVQERTVTQHLEMDADFAEACGHAIDQFREHLEVIAIDRAVNGTVNDVFHQGLKCGVKRTYSDKLLETLLKANKPEKYNTAVKVDATVKAGVMLVAPPALSESEWLEKENASDKE